MTKLTRRERTLLYAMFLILFAAGAFLLARPLAASRDAAQEQLAQDREAAQLMERQIALAQTYEGQISACKEEITALSGSLPAPMVSNRADQMVTNLALRHRLTPVKETISDPVNTPIPVYLSQPAEQGSAPQGEEEAVGALVTTEIELQAYGTLSNLQNLLEEIKDLPELRVTQYKTTVERSKDEASNASSRTLFTIHFAIYQYQEGE
ncbi:type II secretion system protein M [bacterium 210820-DFI.6.52]|nr:type II secretion system protein M [bacterium 210820-DFI.6.52]